MQFKDSQGKTYDFQPTKEQEAFINNFNSDFDVAKRYVFNYVFNIWNMAYKQYSLNTEDREQALRSKGQDWRSNTNFGMARSRIDSIVSSMLTNPVPFIGTPINEVGLRNKDNILKTLNFIADKTDFHMEQKKALTDGIICGTFFFAVDYVKTKNTSKEILTVINGIPQKMKYKTNEQNHPTCRAVSPYDIFPDPIGGDMRFCFERRIINQFTLYKEFQGLVESSANELDKKATKAILENISINLNGADLKDYGCISNNNLFYKNEKYRSLDNTYNQSNSMNPQDSVPYYASSQSDPNEDMTNMVNMVEVKVGYYQHKMMVMANNYPIFIGENPFGFIPYVIVPASHTRGRFGEGIPYLISDIENLFNNFMNNHADSAKALANPAMELVSGYMLNNERQVLEEGLAP